MVDGSLSDPYGRLQQMSFGSGELKIVGQGVDFEKRLEAAELRLANAIGQLETALETQSLKQGSSNEGIEAGLAEEISRLHSENVELKSIVGQTSHRLDTTIGKLKDHLASQANHQAEGQA